MQQLPLLTVAEEALWLVLYNNSTYCPREKTDSKWLFRDPQTLHVTVNSISVFHMIH